MLRLPALLAIVALATPSFAAPLIRFESSQFGNLFVAGQSPTLQVTVTADETGYRGRLRVGAADPYGRRAGRLSRAVALAPHASMTATFTLRTHGLGQFDVRASVTAGRHRERGDAVTSVAIVPPVADTPADASGLGYFIYPLPAELPYAASIAAEMRLLGIRWVRFGFQGWRDERTEPLDRSDPDWLDTSGYERWVDAFRAEGIEVLTTLFGVPRWASSKPDDTTPVSGLPTWGLVAPRDPEEWRLIVRTLAERLAGRVRYWEVWNEPNHFLYWGSSATDFVTLLRTTASALRDVDPTARIVLNFAPAFIGPFESEVLENAAGDIDIFGWHYAEPEDVDAARAMLPRFRPGAAVWDTEAAGAPRRHVSAWLAERAAGAERVFPFVYHLPGEEFLSGVAAFGHYPVNIDYTPRPDAMALRTLSDAVGSAPSLTRAEAGLGYATFTAPDGVVALADMNQPGVTWSGPPGLDLELEVPATVRTLYATDLMGNRRTVRVRRGQARLRSLGMAEFLRAEPADALTSVRVVTVGRAGR